MVRTFAVALALLASGAAHAEWPERPVQVIVPYAAGAATDVLARALIETMRERIGGNFAVVNRDGASSTLGAAQIAQAKPDGYTLGFTAIGPITIQPHLNRQITYRPGSFDAICQTFDLPFAIAVAPGSRFTSLQDIVAASRAEPGRLNYGVTGTATVPHLAMIGWQLASGLKFTDVPYRGETLILPALQNGDLDFAVVTPGFGHTQGLRMFATFTEKRIAEVENLPTLAEFGWNVVQTVPGGLLAPKGLDAALVARLETACEVAVKSERYGAIMKQTRQPQVYKGAADFAKEIAADFEAKGALIAQSGIKTQ
jgi:tripartite-type tricarboxylate transporter receptor subunit TctC